MGVSVDEGGGLNIHPDAENLIARYRGMLADVQHRNLVLQQALEEVTTERETLQAQLDVLTGPSS